MVSKPPKIKNRGNQCYIIALIQALFLIRDIITTSGCVNNVSNKQLLLLELLHQNCDEDDSYELDTKYYDLFMYDDQEMAQQDPSEILESKIDFFVNNLLNFNF